MDTMTDVEYEMMLNEKRCRCNVCVEMLMEGIE